MLKPAAVVLSLTLSSAALAGGGFSPLKVADHIFTKTDRDGNGEMTRGEHDAAKLERYGSTFEMFDLDKNEVVTLQEFRTVFMKFHRTAKDKEV